MRRFYENLVKRSMTKAAALAEAKNWLRTLEREQVKKLAREVTSRARLGKVEVTSPKKDKSGKHPYAHPHYWAPFILIGVGE
jgi:CHAT domain-containing protein